jgi:hypothetical protein
LDGVVVLVCSGMLLKASESTLSLRLRLMLRDSESERGVGDISAFADLLFMIEGDPNDER